MKPIKILTTVAFVMLAASIVLIIIGVYKYTEKDKFLKQCTLIKCKVINIEEKRAGRPVYTFKDINGTYPPFTYAESYDPDEGEADYVLNETYDVYYYSKNPALSEPQGFFVNHGDEFIFLIIGFAFMLDFPMMLFVVSMQKKKLMKNQTTTYGIKDNVISE